jgi:hypothetical protein
MKTFRDRRHGLKKLEEQCASALVRDGETAKVGIMLIVSLVKFPCRMLFGVRGEIGDVQRDKDKRLAEYFFPARELKTALAHQLERLTKEEIA